MSRIKADMWVRLPEQLGNAEGITRGTDAHGERADQGDTMWAVFVNGPTHPSGHDSGYLVYCPAAWLTPLDHKPVTLHLELADAYLQAIKDAVADPARVVVTGWFSALMDAAAQAHRLAFQWHHPDDANQAIDILGSLAQVWMTDDETGALYERIYPGRGAAQRRRFVSEHEMSPQAAAERAAAIDALRRLADVYGLQIGEVGR